MVDLNVTLLIVDEGGLWKLMTMKEFMVRFVQTKKEEVGYNFHKIYEILPDSDQLLKPVTVKDIFDTFIGLLD